MRRERERECDGRGIVYAPIYAEEAHRLRWNTHSEQDLRKRKLGIVVFWYGDERKEEESGVDVGFQLNSR